MELFILSMYNLKELESIVEKSIMTLDLSGEPKELYEPIEYIISIGGKRIRPRMCLLTFSLFSNNIDEHILYPAIGLEIFHAFTLIHDDIMDKADLRRGQLTIHKKWNDNIAILSGDVMSIKSFEYISKVPSTKHKPVLDLFTKTASQVCEGQQFDMNFENEPIITIDEYIEMIGLKTAVLIACAAKMGAIIGGSSDQVADALYDYGYQLGLAFQITDDFLDVYSDSSTLGKNVGGDIVNNKKSWLLVETLKLAEGEDKKELERLLSLSESNAEEKIRGMKALYAKLEIDKKAEEVIEKYHSAALETIENIGLDEKQINLLKEYAKLLTNRKK